MESARRSIRGHLERRGHRDERHVQPRASQQCPIDLRSDQRTARGEGKRNYSVSAGDATRLGSVNGPDSNTQRRQPMRIRTFVAPATKFCTKSGRFMGSPDVQEADERLAHETRLRRVPYGTYAEQAHKFFSATLPQTIAALEEINPPES